MSRGEREVDETSPLAARMRPNSFDEFFGQTHLVGREAAFRKAVEADRIGSIILWGPPGVGKTSLAEIIAKTTRAEFERISAVSSGVSDLRRIVENARLRRRPPKPSESNLFAGEEKPSGLRTILFIDEIHRFNKAQQDAILPDVESGMVTLIGATTENPSFEVNSAILSRCRVFVLSSLSDEEIAAVMRQAVSDPVRGFGRLTIQFPEDAFSAIVGLANGDARSALNILELCVSIAEASEGTDKISIDLPLVESAVQRRLLLYDKDGEQHYDLISALHKTVRGSDVDASLYWLGRMLEAGEDPLYIARRVVRMASEDIGLADPGALSLCMAAQQAVHFVGMPEGALALAQAVAYLAAAPKSNAIYRAYKRVVEDVKTTRNDPVPLHLRNAPTPLMKDLGYSTGYKYAHEFEQGLVYQQNLPDAIKDKRYYEPTDRGYELGLGKRIQAIRDLFSSQEN